MTESLFIAEEAHGQSSTDRGYHNPRRLRSAGRAPISNTNIFTYDASKHGKRFLVNRYVEPDHVSPFTVVLNAIVGMK